MIDLKQRSIEIIKDNQAPSGAYAASPTFSQYGYSWFRDGMWIAHSMDCVGEHASASAFHQWAGRTIMRYEAHINHLLAKIARQEKLIDADFLPTRFTVDSALGEEDWPDFQLDGYGAWLWGVVYHCQHYNVAALWETVRPAVSLLVRYLEALWQFPNYDCWEEFREEQHLATFATMYGGLCAVHTYDSTLVTTDILQEIRQFTLTHGLSSDGHYMKYIGNSNVDASLLWIAVPFKLAPLDDPHFLQTLAKIETDIYRANGGVYRYAQDTYFGGGEWLLLTCWLAWVYLRLDRDDEAKTLLKWVEAQATVTGDMPEQVNDFLLDPSYYQPWVERWGTPACPLLWSHAMYLILQTEMEAKR